MSENLAKVSLSIAEQLARNELLDMVPYQSARRLFSSSEGQNNIWLNANEAAGTGEYQINSDNINRYPDFQPESLLTAYSQYTQQPVENILATRGADEGIELLIRTFCTAYQDNILICPPTYGMYAISAENHGAGIVKVPLVGNQLDIDGLKAQVGKVKVVFLCSPGNPTGNLLPQEQLKTAIELFQDTAIVVVDEAYIEFCPDKSVISWLSEYKNLVIVRTLSKAFALAGLRCGFTLSSKEVITLLSKVIAPYPIAAPVAEIASKALTNDLGVMQARVNSAHSLREQLSEWLKQQKWCSEVFNSDANFVLFRCNNIDEKNKVFNFLVEHNILIRDQSKQVQLDNCLRISIGSEDEISQLKQLLDTL